MGTLKSKAPMTKTASINMGKNINTHVYQYSKNLWSTKWRHKYLEQLPHKPFLTLQCISFWSYAFYIVCFETVTSSEKRQWGGKTESPAGMKEFGRYNSRFLKEGRTWIVWWGHLVILIQLHGWTQELWANLTTQVWTCTFHGLEPTTVPWTDSISNIWLTSAIENGELISQTFVTFS